jgi:tetratricopeptide (TPR) repeat protein
LAYAAYQAGNLEGARNDYQQALREESTNRDALLGLAAVETRAQRYEIAADIYGRLLQADPRDPHAHAGLLALRGQAADPEAVESRLKTLLAADPEAGVLHFALGNHYVQQRRWADAQQAYAKAVASDPDNPDYAYNLAVSLEHLRQPGPALDYYRRALSLAQKRIPSFDRSAARERVQQLAR